MRGIRSGQLPVFVELRPAPACRARPTSTLRVTMSSISRARSSASASVEAGPPTTSGACRIAGPLPGPRRDQLRQQSAGAASPSDRGRNFQRRVAAGVRPPSRTPVRPRRCRRARRCAATSRRRFSAHREKSPRQPPGAPGRQIERRLRQLRRIVARASNPSTSRPSTSAAMTLRKNGTETGTLKTRMGFLIRGSGGQYRERIRIGHGWRGLTRLCPRR